MTKMLLLGTLLLVGCCLSAAYPNLPNQVEGRIVNGADTKIEQYPHQVALLYGGRHWCGGSIINSQWVLTAAHCVNGYDYKQFSICSEATKTHCKDGRKHNIIRIVEHPNYNQAEDTDDDFCLIRVNEHFRLSNNLKAKAIELTTREPPEGSWTTVTGWGALYEDGPLPEVLQKVDVPIVARTKCSKYYGGGITQNMICAGFDEGKKDSCQGDSGGPLVTFNGKNYVQVGVVSWGIGCAGPRRPGVYANVVKAVDWIKATTK